MFKNLMLKDILKEEKEKEEKIKKLLLSQMFNFFIIHGKSRMITGPKRA